jgi:predicted AAA+ superfamily ATPase
VEIRQIKKNDYFLGARQVGKTWLIKEFGKTEYRQMVYVNFDEIQSVPQGINSLKYFDENAPEYQIIAAGSLLDINIHPGESFPVGKVNYLQLYPMSFYEFLLRTSLSDFKQ